MFNGETMVIK